MQNFRNEFDDDTASLNAFPSFFAQLQSCVATSARCGEAEHMMGKHCRINNETIVVFFFSIILVLGKKNQKLF